MLRRTCRAPALLFIALILMGAFGALVPVAAPVARAQAAAPASQPVAGTNGAVPVPPAVDSGAAYSEFMAKIMSLFAWLLGAATLMLDYAVYYGVVVMGDFVKELSAIGVTWRILRDIGNIALIFGFIASGIAVIINVDKYGFGSKLLPMLLVAAVFLNFSLFISEAIIDVNNLFATEIYKQINNGEIVGPSKLNAPNAVVNEGISNRIMSVLGLPSLYNVATDNADILKEAQDKLRGSSWYVGFMGIILFIVASFVLFSLAFVIIARFVALVFLIVVAPIGFAGLAIPQLKGLASKWWSQLFEQAITAPVLLLLLYIALAVITDANFLTGVGTVSGSDCNAESEWFCSGSTSWTGFLETASGGGTGRFAGILFSFLVAMGLLLAVVVFAKRMSAFGAGVATKLAGKATFGTVSWAGRATLGTAGNLLASKRMQAWATPGKDDKGARRYMRYALRPLTSTGKGLRAGTYDMRNAPGFGAGLAALGGLFGTPIDVGKGATLTAQQIHEKRYGGKAVTKYFAESGAQYQAAKREIDLKDAIASGTVTPAQMAKISLKELEQLDGIKKGVEALVTNLSPQQFEALLKSTVLTDAQKANINNGRYAGLSRATASGVPADIQAQLRGMGKTDLENLPADLRTGAVMQNLNPDQLETMMKSEKYSEADRQSMAGSRFAPLTTAIAAGVPATVIGRQVRGMSKTDIEYLPMSTLLNPSVLTQLSDSQRDDLESSKRRTAGERAEVRNARPEVIFESSFRTGAPLPALNTLTIPQIGRLAADVVSDAHVAPQLTPAMLIELQERKRLTATQIANVGGHIRAVGVVGMPAYDFITTGPGRAYWS